MGKRKKADNSWPIFVAVDRLGIPLEVAVDTAVKKGWTVSAAFLDFLLGAVEARWSREKVRSDIREACGPLRLFHDFDAEGWLFWADGAFNAEKETEVEPQQLGLCAVSGGSLAEEAGGQDDPTRADGPQDDVEQPQGVQEPLPAPTDGQGEVDSAEDP